MQILSFPASRTGPTWQIARTTLLPAVLPNLRCDWLGHLAGEFFTHLLRLALLPLVAKPRSHERSSKRLGVGGALLPSARGGHALCRCRQRTYGP
jgi:hypothetical protein